MSVESGISAFPEEDNIFCWKGTIAGSKDTVFQGIVYKMSFSFPNDYPFKPPKVKFETGCFHPNVDVWKYLLRHSSEMLRQVLVTTGFGSKQGAMRRETHNELQKHLSTEGHPYHKFSTGHLDSTWSTIDGIRQAKWWLIGGELMDFIIVLHDLKAVKTFCSLMHFSLGAGYSAAAGPVGRVLEADLRAGDRGSRMCYTYSCSKGTAFATRMDINLRFYGDSYLTTSDILLGMESRPKAAKPLYAVLEDLFSSLQ
ncbi:hypothetical protein SO802_006506 [Lithocarpus litseifolius]|uniref:UBC core domain-containing protein n=1 Tax=Lithocarpus litseifolius TaxID=425828 RepID=A0AAW2DP59_9ROSI